MTEKLLPCPFCKSEHVAVYHDDYACSCKIQCECGCSVEWSSDCTTKEDLEKLVIEKWNTRAQCPECERKKKAIEHISFHLEMVLCAMQVAYVEMCNTGADNAMRWIENTLDGPGLIPDVPKGITAQEFFDKEMAELESRMRNETN